MAMKKVHYTKTGGWVELTQEDKRIAKKYGIKFRKTQKRAPVKKYKLLLKKIQGFD